MSMFGGPNPREQFGREMADQHMSDEIAAGEAHQEQDRLRKEAWAARGGTPVHRLWRWMRRAVDVEDRG